MKDWTEERLGNNVKHKKGFAFRSESFQATGYPIIKVANFTENSISGEALDYVDERTYNDHIEYRLSSGDVIIQTVGSWPSNPESVVGKVVKVPRSLDGALLNQNAVILYPSNKIDSSFFYYLLRSNNFKGYIINTAQGAANQASITLESIFRFAFYLPHPTEQKRIAAILSTYDELIENNKRRIGLLEKLAEEIYREWFVRLRFPRHEEIKTCKRVPEGWRVAKLGDLVPDAGLQTGKRPKGGAEESGLPSIGAENVIKLAQHDFSKEKYVSEKFFESMRQGHVADKDILFYKDGAEIGRVTLVQDGFPHEKCSVNEHVFLIRTHNLSAQYFLYFYLSQPVIQEHMKTINKNAAQPGINKAELRSIPILLPTGGLIAGFERVVSPIIRRIFQLAKAERVLTKTRDLLLPRLVSGKLSVESLDIQFPPGMAEELNDAPAAAAHA